MQKKSKEKQNKNIKNTITAVLPILTALVFISSVILIIFFSTRDYNKYKWQDYNDYAKSQISLEQTFKMDKEPYYVFFYLYDEKTGERNKASEDTKEDVFRYIENGPRKLYIINGENYYSSLAQYNSKGEGILNIYVKDYKDLKIPYEKFPLLVLIQNGEVVSYVTGSSSIKNQLSIR